MRKSRGESITSCLSRSNSSDSELNIRLLSLVASPPREKRSGKRNFSECSDRTNATQGSLSTTMESCCRICHDGEGDEKLMRACRCHGSIKHVHHECLLNWVSISGDLTCEICKFNYNVTRSRRKKFSEWTLPSIEVQGWLHIVLFLAFFAMLITSLSWVVWSQTSSSSAAIFERTSTEIKYAYLLNAIFILTAIIGITLDSCRQARRYFQRTLALNQEIVIQEYTEKDDNQPTHNRRETLDSQTLLALHSRQLCNRNLNSSLTQDSEALQNDFHSREGRMHSHTDMPGYSTFVEIDLDNDEESSTTLFTDVEYSLECPRNFDNLSDLAETRI